MREQHTGSHSISDPMASYLYLLGLEGGQDADTGTVDWFGWYGLFGRNILREDSQGFVDRTRYASREEARRVFEEIDAEYAEWEND